MLQSPTTAGQFDMWKNRSVSYVEECRHTQIRWYPPLIKPSATEPYYIRPVSYVEEYISFICGKMQMYAGQMYYMRSASYLQSCLTFWGDAIEQMKMYPPSSGQEQYYVRSVWHLQSDIRSPCHLQSGMTRSDLSNKLQCRGMSTVLKWIWVHEQLTRKSL